MSTLFSFTPAFYSVILDISQFISLIIDVYVVSNFLPL